MLAHSYWRSIEKGCADNAIIPRMRVAIGFVSYFCLCAAATPAFRLPAIAHPTRYELELTIVPREAEFHGVTRVWVEFTKPSKSLWLNAKGLTIENASMAVNGSRQSVK